MPTADPAASPDAGRAREAEQLARITVEVRPDGTSCRFELAKGLTFAEATQHVLTARDAITAEVDARMGCPAAPKATLPARAAAEDEAPTFGPALEAALRADREAQAEAHEPASDDPGTMSGIERLDAAAEAGWALRRAILADKQAAVSAALAASRGVPGEGPALTVEGLAERAGEFFREQFEFDPDQCEVEGLVAYILTGRAPGPERDAALSVILARLSPDAAPAGPADRLREAAPDDALLIDELLGFRRQFSDRECDGSPLRIRAEGGESEQTEANLRAVLWDAAARIKAIVSVEADGGWQPIETAEHDELVMLGWWDRSAPGRPPRWECEVGKASWGRRNAIVSSMTRHGSATHWRPRPAPPAPASTTEASL